MKLKHLFILAAVFVFLGAVSFFQKISSDRAAVSGVRHEEWHPLIPPESAARVVISRQGYPELSLVKQGRGWAVESLSGVAADSAKVMDLITAINSMKAELRAEGQPLYSRFGLEDQAAFRVQVSDARNKGIVDFYIGDLRAGKGVFLRLYGKSKIFFAPDDLPAAFGLFADLKEAAPPPLFFAELRLVPDTFDQLQRVELTDLTKGGRVTLAALERASMDPGAEWKYVSPEWKFEVSPDKVEEYLGHVTGAHAENIVTGSVKIQTQLEMTLRNGTGKVLRLIFMRADKGWYVKRENEAVVFQISQMVFDDLKADDVLFARENPLGLQIDGAATVELAHDNRTETFSKASGWASAAAILDSAMRMSFVGVDREIKADKLAGFPPTHVLRVKGPGVFFAQVSFYVTDRKQQEIKTVIEGDKHVYLISRAFFETIFIPEDKPPVQEKPAA